MACNCNEPCTNIVQKPWAPFDKEHPSLKKFKIHFSTYELWFKTQYWNLSMTLESQVGTEQRNGDPNFANFLVCALIVTPPPPFFLNCYPLIDLFFWQWTWTLGISLTWGLKSLIWSHSCRRVLSLLKRPVKFYKGSDNETWIKQGEWNLASAQETTSWPLACAGFRWSMVLGQIAQTVTMLRNWHWWCDSSCGFL